MEAEKAIGLIKEGMELLRKGGVFMGTLAEDGQKLVEKGLFIIEQSISQTKAREGLLNGEHVSIKRTRID